MRVFRVQPGTAEPDALRQYLYDATGQRVKKLVRHTGRAYVETSLHRRRVRAPFDHASVGAAAGEQHVARHGRPVAADRAGCASVAPFPADAVPPVQYQLGDHLGKQRRRGRCVGPDERSSIARNTRPTERPASAASRSKRYRFAGKERDEESGLCHLGARSLAPWLGRWLSCDPAGWLEGPNAYRYAKCNPNTRVDPNGTQSYSPPDPLPTAVGAGDTTRTSAPIATTLTDVNALNAPENAAGVGEHQFERNLKLQTSAGSSISYQQTSRFGVANLGSGYRLDAGSTAGATVGVNFNWTDNPHPEGGVRPTIDLLAGARLHLGQEKLSPDPARNFGGYLSVYVNDQNYKGTDSHRYLSTSGTFAYSIVGTGLLTSWPLNLNAGGAISGTRNRQDVRYPFSLGVVTGPQLALSGSVALNPELGLTHNWSMFTGSAPTARATDTWLLGVGLSVADEAQAKQWGLALESTVEMGSKPFVTVFFFVGWGMSERPADKPRPPTAYEWVFGR